MNHITIDGIVKDEARMELFHEKDGSETPMLVFLLLDTGAPFSKKRPTCIEVNLKKGDAATSIYPYMKTGKPVIVYGSLETKGTKDPRYFIAADIVKFMPKGEAV